MNSRQNWMSVLVYFLFLALALAAILIANADKAPWYLLAAAIVLFVALWLAGASLAWGTLGKKLYLENVPSISRLMAALTGPWALPLMVLAGPFFWVWTLRLRPRQRCPACKAAIPGNVPQCPNCRAAVPVAPPPPARVSAPAAPQYAPAAPAVAAQAALMAYCPSCGNALRPGVKFCAKCGARL